MPVALAFSSRWGPVPDTLSPEVQHHRDVLVNIEMSLQSLDQQAGRAGSQSQSLRAEETRELHHRQFCAKADLARTIENDKRNPYIAEYPSQARLLVDQQQPPFDKEELRIVHSIREKIREWTDDWPTVSADELEVLSFEHRDGYGKSFWTAVVANPLVINPRYATFRAGLPGECATRMKALAALRDDLSFVSWGEPLQDGSKPW